MGRAKLASVTHLRPATNVVAAEWVTAGLRGFAESVLSLVPAGFSRYVRLFHPAYRISTGTRATTTVPVPWRDIAAANGRRVHAGMQLGRLTGSDAFHERGQPGVFDQPPEVGSLPEKLAAALARVLARHTTTPDRCWFAIWHGFGDLLEVVSRAPTFPAPNRQYHLLQGSVDALAEGVTVLREQGPNLCWPKDRAWCVATEIDLNTTYIGCDSACGDEILAQPEMEVLAIDPATGIDFASDLINR